MSLEKSAPAKHHIASLDGVRGVAVLLVLLHHHGWLKSGWLGVDLFFVLSGYLITGILRSSRSEVAYWQPFWIKRVTRIFPPLVAVLCVSRLLGFISPC
jgi:peptidoglycan/LPS O-acetylase OafA/YrhL